MKKTLLTVITLILAEFCQAQTIVAIGNGTGSGTSSPVASWYDSSATESIYTASEVGVAGTITKLAFQKASGSSTVNPSVKIYLKNTVTSGLSASYTIGTDGFNAYTLVYDGTLPNSTATGWMEVTLQTPFNYTGGTKNLSLLVTGSTCIDSGRPQYRYTTTTGSKMSAGYNDGTIGCGGNNPFTPASSMAPVWERPNLQLTFSTLDLIAPLDAARIMVVSNNSGLTITSAKTGLAAVTVYDLAGRQLFTAPDIDAATLTISSLPQTGTILLVKVTDVENRQTVKKVLY